MSNNFKEKEEAKFYKGLKENGYKIKVGITEQETIGIDTPEDMEKALAFLANR